MVAAALSVSALLPCPAGATLAAPGWQLTVSSQPTQLVPESSRQGFLVVATNVGAADTSGVITVTDSLPAGLLPAAQSEGCEALGQSIRCVFEEVLHPGESLARFLPVTVGAGAGITLKNLVSVQGGGAEAKEATVETDLGAPPPAFGFLPGRSGLEGVLGGLDGTPVTRAGSAPYEFVVAVGFPTEMIESQLSNAGHPRDVAVDLPPGLVLNPASTPRCRETQLEREACPPASQVGLAGIGASVNLSEVGFENTPLYNVVPPPGQASSLGFVFQGIPLHLLGSLRAGDYGLSAEADSLLAKFPISGLQLQFWGDPSDPSHDAVRGAPVAASTLPLLTLPSACGPLELGARTVSWENPRAFVSRSVPIGGLTGDPLEVEGCSGLAFEPAVSVQPSTTVADSPGGLEATVQVPQRLDPEGSRASSLRRATVTLPPGMVINPSAAGGLAACTPAQVGLVSQVGQPSARFDGDPVACPDASKLGTVEVVTPLVQDEPEEGTLVRHPLTGSIYLARPHQNPFGSLFAVYAVVEDPERDIAIKLAGEVTIDPATGQMTATLDEIPQLPLEEFKLDFFEGPRAALRTPALCGSYVSHAGLTPWSGTATVQDESRLSISTGPAGATCANSLGQLPNSPRFDAGSVVIAAGHHSPFVLSLSRRDGSQELGALELTMPPGLIGGLAGSTRCSDAALSAAATKSGAEEEAGSSCPASSQVGHLSVAVGAGSNPYEVEGKVYLAGPYKGAPLSLAVVTPAVAGPFDLGTEVVRSAVFVDPRTGRLTIRSDPLPSMLAGVPLDVRSLRLEIDKAGLIRNPTSCEPMAITGSATSIIGQVAPLSSRFQVGDCAALRFKPKLSLRLSGALRRGGHPAVRAVLRTDPKGAALRSASFALPAGELLDLKHVRALCPRKVAVGRCPGASRLGSISIFSPSLGSPLKGAVYLRVPSHRLPDLIAEVRSGELRFLLHGRTTAVKGRIGVALGSLPDIPLSRAILSLAGGRRGILVNSRSLCPRPGRGTASFSAHNGMRRSLVVAVRPRGCR